jgi:hypothetical protein
MDPYAVQLYELGVVEARCAEAKDHLGGQRVGITTYMVDEEIWLLKNAHEHGSILQILIGDVCARDSDV